MKAAMHDIDNAQLEVLLFNWIFSSCSMTKGHCNVIENHEKTYWSFQMTSNLTCLLYKNHAR